MDVVAASTDATDRSAAVTLERMLVNLGELADLSTSSFTASAPANGFIPVIAPVAVQVR